MELHERETAIELLKDSRQRVLAAVSGLSGEQLTFRLAEDQWSVSDCLEHINVVEASVYAAIQKTLSRPPRPEKRAEAAGKLEIVQRALADRGRKLAGPPEMMPRRERIEFSELVMEFERIRAATLAFTAETSSDLHDYFFPHLFFGTMDCYQWLMLLGWHADRHIAQMEEVKAAHG